MNSDSLFGKVKHSEELANLKKFAQFITDTTDYIGSVDLSRDGYFIHLKVVLTDKYTGKVFLTRTIDFNIKNDFSTIVAEIEGLLLWVVVTFWNKRLSNIPRFNEKFRFETDRRNNLVLHYKQETNNPSIELYFNTRDLEIEVTISYKEVFDSIEKYLNIDDLGLLHTTNGSLVKFPKTVNSYEFSGRIPFTKLIRGIGELDGVIREGRLFAVDKEN